MKRAFAKKAFTLAELSIVLVVLGIIMAMTLKGFGVLDAARLRNELGKISKFQTAYSLYFERTGRILPQAAGTFLPDGRLDHTPLYEFGLLEDDADFNRDFASKTDPDNLTNQLFLAMCDRDGIAGGDNITSFKSVSYSNAGAADGVCLVFDKYYPTFICGAEISYDDMKIYDGSGRHWGNSADIQNEVTAWIDNNPKKLYNCSKAEKGNTNYAWAYMIM